MYCRHVKQLAKTLSPAALSAGFRVFSRFAFAARVFDEAECTSEAQTAHHSLVAAQELRHVTQKSHDRNVGRSPEHCYAISSEQEAEIHVPTVLAKFAGGQRTLDAHGATLGEVVDDVADRFPDLAPRLRNESGEPYPFVTFYLNDDDVRFSGGFSATVSDGDEIIIVPALAGG